MATSQEIDAAMALVTATRSQKASATDERDRALYARDSAEAILLAAGAKVDATCDAMDAAKAALIALLNQPETDRADI